MGGWGGGGGRVDPSYISYMVINPYFFMAIFRSLCVREYFFEFSALLRENQWLISPKNKVGYFWGAYFGGQ